MRRTKQRNCLAPIGGKAAGTSLREGRRGIGNSIHLKLLVCRWCDCPALKRPKLFSLIANAATLLLLLAGCSGGVLEPQGPIGAANIQILLNALGIMLVIVVPTIIARAGFRLVVPRFQHAGALPARLRLFRPHRAHRLGDPAPGHLVSRRRDLDRRRTISIPSSRSKRRKSRSRCRSSRSIGNGCSSTRAQGVASVNELVVPVEVPVHFSLTSASVMNMFFVPQLGSMIATMNGMVTQLMLQADQPGELYGQSAQFSGDGFSGMNFIVHAVPQDRFQQWVAHSATDRAGARPRRLPRAVAAEPERGAVHLSVGRAQPVRRHRQSEIPAGPRPAGEQRRGAPFVQQQEPLTCLASSPGTRSPGVSRSRSSPAGS